MQAAKKRRKSASPYLPIICGHFQIFRPTVLMPTCTDNGHPDPEGAFFQKFETFGLRQTNWAEILGGILALSSQTIGTILAL